MAAAGASIAALRERRRAKAWKEEYLALLAAAESLRRMAVELAQEGGPEEIFAAVADGICRVASADVVHLVRNQPDGARTELAVWPAEISGVRSTLEVPIVVDDEPWGALVVGFARRKHWPPTAEYRLRGFSEYVGSAISSSQSRAELTRLLSEQQALRRVATLVASEAAPQDVFAAVAEESGRVFDADIGYLCCFQAGEIMRVLAAWSDSGNHAQPGTVIPLKGEGASVKVLRTGRAARVDSYEGMSGPLVDVVRATGAVSSVASPVVVDGRVWGIVSLASREPGRFPPETEACLADFAELVSSAIGNTEARTQLAASRARIVAASDETRRRIERNLHDGTQQRLVTLALQLRGARNAVPAQQGELRDQLERQVRDHHLEKHVLLPGFRPDVIGCIKGFDLFVMSSVTEGLGTSLLDAMAASRPIVATTAGGIPEIVVDGVTGMLVPPRDARALAAAIVGALGDASLQHRMGAAGFARVRECFTVERMVAATAAVYEQLLQTRGSRLGA
jgi:GAF domain-containing protein